MAARCHWFWWSTSATESRYLWRIPSTMGRTAPRLAFSDRLSGTWRSKHTAAACTPPLWRAEVAMWASAFGDEQAADFLDRVVLARAEDGDPHGRRTSREARAREDEVGTPAGGGDDAVPALRLVHVSRGRVGLGAGAVGPGGAALPHLEDDVLDARGAGDGPRPDARGHLELFGAFVPEPRVESGEAGRARVDADLGRRDLAEGGAPDLPDARHGRQRGRRGEAAVGIQRHAVDLLTDDRTGQVGHDECVQPAGLPEPGVAAGSPAAEHASRHPRVLVRRRPVRITGTDRSGATALPRSDDPDEEAVATRTAASRWWILIWFVGLSGRHSCVHEYEAQQNAQCLHSCTLSPSAGAKSAMRQCPVWSLERSTDQVFTFGFRGLPPPTCCPALSTTR